LGGWWLAVVGSGGPGQGGLGRVWLADNEKVNRRVALKKFKLSEQASE
jgi:hypothetical protein